MERVKTLLNNISPAVVSSQSAVSSPTVVVGMSGGVDSSLTAALLQDQGYNVIGVYMKNWSEVIKGVEHCPWITDQLDARQVAHQLNIPFYSVNFEKQYKAHVIESFFTDYAAGRTPNPDVLCNQFIKFEAFFDYARSLGADFIATGHYARIINGQLYKGLDPKKDQSYFLWAIQPQVLQHVLFPLGELTKKAVRALAKEKGLITAQKKDSQGICFIGQADVRDFLSQHFLTHQGFGPGNVLDSSGKIVGTHQGAGFYTLGQRSGVGDIEWKDNTSRPKLYVSDIDIQKNTITIGEESLLYHKKLRATDASWLGPQPKRGVQLTAKIRYGQTNVTCGILNSTDHTFELAFTAPQRAITPGQSVVLYDRERVVGGGVIEQVFD